MHSLDNAVQNGFHHIHCPKIEFDIAVVPFLLPLILKYCLPDVGQYPYISLCIPSGPIPNQSNNLKYNFYPSLKIQELTFFYKLAILHINYSYEYHFFYYTNTSCYTTAILAHREECLKFPILLTNTAPPHSVQSPNCSPPALQPLFDNPLKIVLSSIHKVLDFLFLYRSLNILFPLLQDLSSPHTLLLWLLLPYALKFLSVF